MYFSMIMHISVSKCESGNCCSYFYIVAAASSCIKLATTKHGLRLKLTYASNKAGYNDLLLA